MLSLSAVAAVETNSSDDVISTDVDEEPPSGNVENITTEQITASTDDENVSSSNQSDIVASAQKAVSIKGSDLTKTYGNAKKYQATFFDEKGNPLKNADVRFIIKGKTYTQKTDSKGVASQSIGLAPGTYTITAVHPDGSTITNKIVIKSSVSASDLKKHYSSSKSFRATFYNTNGKVLANTNVKFYAKGTYFTSKTNSKGVATLKIISKPGSFKVKSINPKTGESKTKTVTVLSTLSASKMTVFTDKTSSFKVTLYKNEKLVKNAKVYIYIKGKKISAKTNSKGVASVNFKLAKGTYTFKSVDPYTDWSIKTKVVVKLASIKASNMITHEGKTSKYSVTVLKQNGKVAPNTNIKITLNGKTYTVKSNSKGVATLSFNLKEGSYTVKCSDPRTNYKVSKKITVYESNSGKKYNKYGVSEDGKTILAIGRASASGEYSKYGYSFYMTEFERICPYCKSTDLYWGIFWAGSET